MRHALGVGGALLAILLSVHAARAACSVAQPPDKTLTVETGVATDAVSNGRASWQERSVTVVSRDGNRFSAYGHAASDSRFGSTDSSYEAGIYSALGAHFIGDVDGSFSPTHTFLPATTESAGLDWRTSGGYGYQSQYAQRNYTSQIAGIVTIGADRYEGLDRFAVGVTLANLSSAPGIAVTTQASFARYLSCDAETFSVSGGRDVEPTGVAGRIAVYKTYSYDVNDVHWFTQRFGLNVGAGWYLLTGAYDRFEMLLALRERL